MMVGYKCEPLEGLGHRAFIQQVFIEVLSCAKWVPISAGDAKGSKRHADRGGCVIDLPAGAPGRE